MVSRWRPGFQPAGNSACGLFPLGVASGEDNSLRYQSLADSHFNFFSLDLVRLHMLEVANSSPIVMPKRRRMKNKGKEPLFMHEAA